MGNHQADLASEGVFVRGGLTIGEVYSSRSHVFGPALVRAYELESQTAKWPVLAVDPSLVEKLMLGVQFCVQDAVSEEFSREGGPSAIHMLARIFNHLAKTPDGVYFVDYIKCFAYEDQTTGDLDYYLEDHRKAICRAREQSDHPKLRFVAGYHNLKCGALFPELGDLLIPGVDPLPDAEWPAVIALGLREARKLNHNLVD